MFVMTFPLRLIRLSETRSSSGNDVFLFHHVDSVNARCINTIIQYVFALKILITYYYNFFDLLYVFTY